METPTRRPHVQQSLLKAESKTPQRNVIELVCEIIRQQEQLKPGYKVICRLAHSWIADRMLSCFIDQ